MASAEFDSFTRNGFLKELADVAHNRAAALRILVSCGLSSDFPEGADAFSFWHDLLRNIDSGGASGVEVIDLAFAALDIFPGNRAFKNFAKALEPDVFVAQHWPKRCQAGTLLKLVGQNARAAARHAITEFEICFPERARPQILYASRTRCGVNHADLEYDETEDFMRRLALRGLRVKGECIEATLEAPSVEAGVSAAFNDNRGRDDPLVNLKVELAGGIQVIVPVAFASMSVQDLLVFALETLRSANEKSIDEVQ